MVFLNKPLNAKRSGNKPFPTQILSKVLLRSKNSEDGIVRIPYLLKGTSWQNYRQNVIELNNKKGCFIFPLLSNSKGVIYPVVVPNNEKITLNLITKTAGNVYFLNETFKTTQKNIDSIKGDFYRCIASKAGNLVTIYSNVKLKLNVSYYFEGLEIPIATSDKTILSRVNVTEYMYIVNTATEFKDDLTYLKDEVKVNNIFDLSLIIDDNLNSYLLEEEEYILKINEFFTLPGCPATNLILCGEGSTKKTSYCLALGKIFNEEIALTSLGTDKSLVPSFYGTEPQLGVILSSKFIAILDEFFRFFSQKDKNIGLGVSIHKGLEQIMNIVDRIEREISSPKGKVKVNFNNSFIATENFNRRFHESFRKLYQNDKAICRRYNFLIWSDETTEKLVNAVESDLDLVFKNINLKLKKISLTKRKGTIVYRDIMKYLRSRICDVEYKGYMLNLMKDIEFKSAGLHSSSKALLIGVVLLNSLFDRRLFKSKKLRPNAKDLVLARKLILRLNKDTCKIYGISDIYG